MRRKLDVANRAACFDDRACGCASPAECKAGPGWHDASNHATAIAAFLETFDPRTLLQPHEIAQRVRLAVKDPPTNA